MRGSEGRLGMGGRERLSGEGERSMEAAQESTGQRAHRAVGSRHTGQEEPKAQSMLLCILFESCYAGLQSSPILHRLSGASLVSMALLVTEEANCPEVTEGTGQ